MKKVQRRTKEETPVSELCYQQKIYITEARPVGASMLDQHVQNLGATLESSAHLAQVFVVDDVLKPPTNVLWNAFLSGGFVLSIEAFCQGEGPTIKYQNVLKIRKSVYMSSAFQAERPDVAGIVAAKIWSQTSNWKLLKELVHFSQVLTKRQVKNRADAELIALVAGSEGRSLAEVCRENSGQRLCCKIWTAEAAAFALAKIDFTKKSSCGH